jgi:hypothetical protein
MKNEVEEEDKEDAVGLVSLLDDQTDPARFTMMRYSSNLHNQAIKQGTTPDRAEATVKIYKRLKRQKRS